MCRCMCGAPTCVGICVVPFLKRVRQDNEFKEVRYTMQPTLKEERERGRKRRRRRKKQLTLFTPDFNALKKPN